ncbi:acetate/propionate family kinase [Agrobacterium rubi]|uniref:Acetate kinase n=1 Tax=Agrobacterium rubi TaxID=28099 RepID=A0AAE7R4B9_9HYPH|nr:acetate/propionate family kinase [Agrobacterium rubi]NTE87850.1 acetate/propionate family kinase [Agrobacterium rubi]NTF05152.1 acetate/propionate family kinase [Agrobacterium rubi]NTF37943.1 acetate/propionate family kinase [Agrobacterium rubi]OCJ54194.1 acetate kinase [Agrobacterium rubi]QTG01803.1 acetate/propionate family kinase [Agrobacterium rubi]
MLEPSDHRHQSLRSNDGKILTFNAGSSSIKMGVFSLETGAPERIGKGTIDFQRKCLSLQIGRSGTSEIALAHSGDMHPDAIVKAVFTSLATHIDISHIAAVGHRMVHGGDVFHCAVAMDDSVLTSVESLLPQAPLHQQHSLELIDAVLRLHPHMFQTASFDTSFHNTNSGLVRRYALPRALHDQGIKRFGFHGLSYSFIAQELVRIAPKIAHAKVVVAHLGSGSSLCGMDGGVSRDVSMGFSTLDGIPMATRCGALDPGVLLYLLTEKNRSPAELEHLLYHESGLLGVSGISSDSRVLIESDLREATEAIDLFAFRTAGETARIVNTLGGMDAFVFTAGIGENQPSIRAAISSHLGWLGLHIDVEANAENAQIISSTDSRIKVFVIATDEEQVIADDACRLLRALQPNWATPT